MPALPWTPDFDPYPISHRLVCAQVEQTHVRLAWDDARESRHHALLLRENSPDQQTIHPLSREMVISPLDLPADLHPVAASVDAHGVLQVTWSHGGHRSAYHPGWLRSHAWFADAHGGKRFIAGIYGDRDDLYSSIRTLQRSVVVAQAST